MNYADLIKTKIGIFIYPTEENIDKQFLIEELQFYKYQEDAEGKPCIIGGEIKTGIKTIYYYYYPNPSASSAEELEVIYEEETPASYQKVYSPNYEKIRSITASESNRFNLIQSLCEIFECWAEFNIQHESDGSISLKDYHPIKTINFKEYIGKDNYAYVDNEMVYCHHNEILAKRIKDVVGFLDSPLFIQLDDNKIVVTMKDGNVKYVNLKQVAYDYEHELHTKPCEG